MITNKNNHGVDIIFITLFSTLLYPFHSDSIEGLDLCHRKPLIVTCSKDHTIRIWNYKTFRLELAKVRGTPI